MKAENRHYTKVWKKRRKHKLGDKCGNAKCMWCHPGKVFKTPTYQTLKQYAKENESNT